MKPIQCKVKTLLALMPIKTALTIWMLLFLSGCQLASSPTETKKYVDAVSARPGKPIAEIPPVVSELHFVYTANTLRDPFKAAAFSKSNNSLASVMPDQKRVKEPLEEFPVDALRVVGTIELETSPWALITGPDKTIYRITIGHHLGKDFGKVIKISSASVLIEEIIPDGMGGWQYKQRELGLNEDNK